MAKILCVDDTRADLELMAAALRDAGHEVTTAEHVPAALQCIESETPDLIVSDYRLPKVSGLEFLNILQRRGLRVPLIMSTAYATVEDAVSAIKAGAVDYVMKPVRPEQLQFAVDQALELTHLRRENAALRGEISELKVKRQILGDSPALREVLETVTTVAPTRATVLIEGASGTGKELLARAIHDLSDRSRGPFIALNCAAIPEHLVESSLFGHEKGAFTGAIGRVAGAFERAHGGTLLLDEISEMQIDLQAKLLRALQEQEFERVGGTTPVSVDVRVIATTNRDLAEHVRAGDFREDLFFRLAVVPIQVPPLADRPEDVVCLANAFAKRSAEANGKKIDGLSSDAVAMLRSYQWPGNVRELEHAIERAVIMCAGETIRPSDFALPGLALMKRTGGGFAHGRSALESGARAGSLGQPGGTSLPGGTTDRGGWASVDTAEVEKDLPWGDTAAFHSELLDDTNGASSESGVLLHTLDVRRAEESLIREALRRTGGNRTRASQLLGINPRTLRNKLNGR